MKIWRPLAVVIGVGMTLFVGTGIAAAAPPAPPGDNGTVKIDGLPFDQAPDNQPHVGCLFQIDFYGYDVGGLTATYAFELQPPTTGTTNDLGSGSLVLQDDPAGGGTDLDGEVTIDLSAALAASGATPQPKQGYHVKLTVHADGSIGADTKYKVFWVTGCGTPTSPPPSSSSPPTTSFDALPASFAVGSGGGWGGALMLLVGIVLLAGGLYSIRVMGRNVR